MNGLANENSDWKIQHKPSDDDDCHGHLELLAPAAAWDLGARSAAAGAHSCGVACTNWNLLMLLMIDKQSRARYAFDRADLFRICKNLEHDATR